MTATRNKIASGSVKTRVDALKNVERQRFLMLVFLPAELVVIILSTLSSYLLFRLRRSVTVNGLKRMVS